MHESCQTHINESCHTQINESCHFHINEACDLRINESCRTHINESHHIYMGWLQLVGSIKYQVSFAEYSLFYRSLLQKRHINLSILITEATPQEYLKQLNTIRGQSGHGPLYSTPGMRCMSHVKHISMSHATGHVTHISMSRTTHTSMSDAAHISTNHVPLKEYLKQPNTNTDQNKSRSTLLDTVHFTRHKECVMHESCQTHINESCHTYRSI